MTWTSADGRVQEISKMATSHIENCLALIDERIPTLMKTRERGEQATRELETKRRQKTEMLRVLGERRIAANKRAEQVFTCHSCKHSDKVQLQYGQMAELVCRKLGFTCKTLKFTCGNWENNNA